jgi:uncharacterized protein (DUF736 family)
MSELGRLSPANPNDLSQLTGYIQTLQTRLSISLSGDERLCDAREPSHRITARARHGGDVQIGSAWLKTAKHGPHKGARFFSITIDDPSLDRPLNVAAIRDDTSDDWIVIWRRRGAQAVVGAAA